MESRGRKTIFEVIDENNVVFQTMFLPLLYNILELPQEIFQFNRYL